MEDHSPARNLGGGRATGRERGAPPSRPLPSFPKLGAPRAPIPVGSLNRAPLLASESRAPWARAEPGAGTVRGRAEVGTRQRAESRRRPFAWGPGARSRPSPRPARRCSELRAHRPHRGRTPTPQPPVPRPRPRERGLRSRGPEVTPQPLRSREIPPPRPLPEKCGTWEMGTSKVFCFVLRLALF